MSNLYTTFKHLFPKALAWLFPFDGFLRKYIDGLSETPADIRDFADNVYRDIFPQTTREIELWEEQFNITSTGTEQQRRDNIAARWIAQGGQGKDYLESIIHGAGFTTVFLHEWFTKTDTGFITKNPNFYLQGPTGIFINQTGRTRSQTGRPKAQTNAESPQPTLFVNQTGRTRSQTGRPRAQTNGAIVQGDGTLLVNKGPGIIYPIPQNLDDFREMIYVAGEIFPDFVNILLSQKDEFERLLLRYLPYSYWIGELINFILSVELWFQVVDSTFGSTTIQDVTRSGSLNRFVAVGGGGKMANSPEGVVWTAVVDTQISSQIRGIAFSESLGIFVAGGNFTAANDQGATSSDGITWANISDMDLATEDMNQVDFSEFLTLFVAVADNGVASQSSDGSSWSAIGDMKFGTEDINGITYAEKLGLFVAVGGNGVGSQSTDGLNWTVIGDMKFGTTTIQDVAFSEDLSIFVAIGNNGKGSFSSDGLSWTLVADTKFGSNTIRGISYAVCSTAFLAVGNGGVMSYSEDGGVTWILVTDSTFSGDIIRAVECQNVEQRCVAVGNNGKMAYSFNGT